MRKSRLAFLASGAVLALAAGVVFGMAILINWWGSWGDLTEDFERPDSLETNWLQIRAGDFSDATAELSGSDSDQKLRLAAGTLETDPGTVKVLGVRAMDSVRLRPPVSISWTLDWNDQSNGSYLSAELLISPQATTASPMDETDWLSVAYIGVPPGRNARLEIRRQLSGDRKRLFSEGWPESNRSGKKIGLQKLQLLISDTGLELRENGLVVFQSSEVLDFGRTYLYLFLTSHSNFRERAVYFDDVEVTKLH